ncbi:signal peptidase II [Dehalococcoidales bacterium]|nr:signal peptidase II [Dehalococcoidales bacterium]
MQKANRSQGKRQNVVFFLTALVVAATDQLSKLWIRSNLAEGQSLAEVGFFQITRVHNYGAAFGLFQDQTFTLIIVALVGISILLLYALFIYPRFSPLHDRLGKLALGLILGGTVGNLIDRLHFGYVTDFISIGIWPVFNLADSAIVVGVITFAYICLFSPSISQSRETMTYPPNKDAKV